MALLSPLLLALLASLPLIVLLHLLRERRRRVAVSSLALWRRFARRTAGPRLRRLPLTWLLFVQLALAALLALALAQPQLTALAGPGTHTIILLDTSASMGASDVTPSRFASALTQARNAIGGLRGADSATLIRVGPQAERLGQAGAGARQALLAQLIGLAPGGVGADLAGALALASAAVDPGSRNRILILTDAAYAMPADPPPALAPITWRVIGGPVGNDAIIAFNAERLPDGDIDLFARVAHYAPQPASREVELLVDERVADARVLNFQPDADVSLSWSVPGESAIVQLALRGPDGLAADDQAILSLAPPAPQRVLLVASGDAAGAALDQALRAQPGLAVTRLATDDYAGQAADLTVFEGFLPAEWPGSGGVLVVNPPEDSALLPASAGGRGGAVRIDPRDPLLAGVDLSGVRFGAVGGIDAGASGLRTVASIGGRPLILRGGASPPLVVLAFDLAESTLPSRVAFPLLVANALAALTPPPLPASLPAGQPLVLGAVDATDVQISGPGGEPLTVVTRPLALRDTFQPGLYTLAVTRSDGSERSERFAVHAGAPRESDLRPRPLVSLDVSQRPPAGRDPAALDVWPLLAAFALVALAVEGWLHWRR